MYDILECIISHDCGTSSTKSVLVALRDDGKSGTVAGVATATYPLHEAGGGKVEQDPADLWGAIVKNTRALLRDTGKDPRQVRAISFAAQMQGTLPVDAQGRPLSRIMNTLDTRGREVVGEMFKGSPFRVSGYPIEKIMKFLSITGGGPGFQGKDTITKLYWVKKRAPELYEKTFKFLDNKDYLVFKCTGEYLTSLDLAWVTWMVDTRKKGREDWSDAILSMYGLDREKLPRIGQTTDLAGDGLSVGAANELGLVEGTPVVNGAGDIGASALGSGATADREFMALVGTSGWACCHVKHKKKDLKTYTGAVASADPDRYLMLAKQDTHGKALEWLHGVVGGEESNGIDHEGIDALVEESPPGANGLFFTPWLSGERSPLNDGNARGMLYNIGLCHKRADVYRAVYEGVAHEVLLAIEAVEALTERAPGIKIAGGCTNSETWCQVLANVWGKEIKKPVHVHQAGAIGAAMLAQVALGKIRSVAESRLVAVERTFVPDGEVVPLHAENHAIFKKIYRHNKKLFKELNATRSER